MSLIEAVSENIPAGEKLKVLIADDDAPTRLLLRTAIAQWGYESIEASDGEDAWNQIVEKDSPKLLIVDWMMPKLDGIQLCKQIRSQLDFHPYIILLTQNTGTANIIVGLEAGADEFLTKPFKMAELRSRLAVGARILANEKKLAKEAEKLNQYLQYSQEINSLLTKAFREIESLQNAIEDKDIAKSKLAEVHNFLKTIQQAAMKIQNQK